MTTKGCLIIGGVTLVLALVAIALPSYSGGPAGWEQRTRDQIRQALAGTEAELVQVKAHAEDLAQQLTIMEKRVERLEAIVEQHARMLEKGAPVNDPPDVPAEEVKEGLIGWWTFDDTTKLIVKDSSGKGNDVRLVGKPTRIPGRMGWALSFDGISDGVVLAERGAGGYMHDGWDQRTVCLWVRQDTRAPEGVLYDEGGRTSGLAIRMGPGGVRVGCRSSDRADMLNLPGPLKLKTWYHVAVIFDRGVLSAYLNGRKVASTKTPFMDLPHHNDDGMLAACGRSDALGHSDVGGLYFNGALDDVRIYNRPLSENEVASLALRRALPVVPQMEPVPPVEPADPPQDADVF